MKRADQKLIAELARRVERGESIVAVTFDTSSFHTRFSIHEAHKNFAVFALEKALVGTSQLTGYKYGERVQ